MILVEQPGEKKDTLLGITVLLNTHKEAELSYLTVWDVREPMLRSAGPLSCKILLKPTMASLHPPGEPLFLIL